MQMQLISISRKLIALIYELIKAIPTFFANLANCDESQKKDLKKFILVFWPVLTNDDIRSFK